RRAPAARPRFPDARGRRARVPHPAPGRVADRARRRGRRRHAARGQRHLRVQRGARVRRGVRRGGAVTATLAPGPACPARRLRRWLRAVAAAAGLCSWSAGAAAYHTDEDRITDDTAWTLQGPKNFRLGLYKASATIADRVVLGTYLWPWLARTASAFGKLRFLSLGPTEWAVAAGFFHLDTAAFDGTGPNAPVF